MNSDEMMMSAAQCRAARALVDWSQDKLAQSASVARATIADFERGVRLDLMRQNMMALVTTLEAAGVEFLPESSDGAGAGVRLRKVELEFSRDARTLEGGLLFSLRYRGAPYRLYVTREALDDLGGLGAAGDGDRVLVAQGHLGQIMRLAELKLERHEVSEDQRVVLSSEDF